MKTIIILGSTGSIGTNTLDIVQRFPSEFRVAGLTAGNNIDKLEEQIRAFAPRVVAVSQEAAAATLRQRCAGLPVEILSGEAGIAQVASLPEAELVISAIVGAAGLVPTLTAIRSGKHIALANKEPMVMAGKLMQDEAHKHNVRIFPVDSEHSAIFQALQCNAPSDLSGDSTIPQNVTSKQSQIEKIILTASGGPLRDWPLEELEKATIEDALAHPTWSMGRKITVDSATMMNKALEVIEAHWLFGLPAEQIQVVIHPQSMIHSMVEYRDGSVIAQLSPPDMKLPIQYALTYPHRTSATAKRMDWSQSQSLSWYPVDPARYPALELGFEVARRGGTCGAVLNAANEAAVELFLQSKVRLTDIAKVCRSVLQHHDFATNPSLAELLRQDRWARDEVMRWNKSLC